MEQIGTTIGIRYTGVGTNTPAYSPMHLVCVENSWVCWQAHTSNKGKTVTRRRTTTHD